MKIILYRKSGCPWAAAVMGFLNELAVPFELRNVTTHPEYAREVEARSGQCKSPTLDIRRERGGCGQGAGGKGNRDLTVFESAFVSAGEARDGPVGEVAAFWQRSFNVSQRLDHFSKGHELIQEFFPGEF
jgi:glutaredoxin